MRQIGSALTAAVIGLAASQGVSSAFAQAASVCVSLEARLVQIEQGGSSDSAAYHQYDAPIAQQQGLLDQATAQARRAGCIGFFIFRSATPDRSCPSLMATVNRMQANLQHLESARDQYPSDDPFTLARERGDVLNALQANRCGPNYVSTDNDARPGGFFATLFGQAQIRTYDSTQDFGYDAGFGTYRTLCVRSCDGFYFPISFSTVPAQFSADEATCQQMCPGAQVSLYTYRNPGEDVSNMVSLSGEPYSALPTAFLYRQKYDKSCTCHSAVAAAPQFTNFEADGTPAPLASDASSMANIPMPRLRPDDAGEDPETLANRAGGLVPEPVTAQAAATEAGETADGRKVRIVGPSYYYGQ